MQQQLVAVVGTQRKVERKTVKLGFLQELYRLIAGCRACRHVTGVRRHAADHHAVKRIVLNNKETRRVAAG